VQPQLGVSLRFSYWSIEFLQNGPSAFAILRSDPQLHRSTDNVDPAGWRPSPDVLHCLAFRQIFNFVTIEKRLCKKIPCQFVCREHAHEVDVFGQMCQS